MKYFIIEVISFQADFESEVNIYEQKRRIYTGRKRKNMRAFTGHKPVRSLKLYLHIYIKCCTAPEGRC